MPLTVEQAARSMLAAIASDANLALAGQWVNERYQEAATRVRFRHLRTVRSIYIPAAVTAGVATATQGSKIITGDATAQAAWAAIGFGARPINEWYIQIVGRVAWTKVVNFRTQDSALELEKPFSELSIPQGAYHLVPRHVSADPDIRHFGSGVFNRLRWPLTLFDLVQLNKVVPDRIYTSYGPTVYAEVGEDPSGAKLLEFYPYSTNPEAVSFVVWLKPPIFAQQDVLPGAIDPYVLKEGALIDAMRFEQAQAIRAGQLDRANAWASMATGQEERWARRMDSLALLDRGVDDAAVILDLRGVPGVRGMRDIRDSRDFIFAQGNRP